MYCFKKIDDKIVHQKSGRYFRRDVIAGDNDTASKHQTWTGYRMKCILLYYVGSPYVHSYCIHVPTAKGNITQSRSKIRYIVYINSIAIGAMKVIVIITNIAVVKPISNNFIFWSSQNKVKPGPPKSINFFKQYW